MEVAFCTLADHANVTRDGKLNVIGIFDRINAKSFPAKHHSMAIVLRFRTRYEDSESTFSVRVSLEEPNGEKLFTADGEVPVGTMQPGQIGHKNTIFSLGNAEFNGEGTHLLRVYINEKLEAEVPFTLRKIE